MDVSNIGSLAVLPADPLEAAWAGTVAEQQELNGVQYTFDSICQRAE
jgi:hypothetical protein